MRRRLTTPVRCRKAISTVFLSLFSCNLLHSTRFFNNSDPVPVLRLGQEAGDNGKIRKSAVSPAKIAAKR